MDSSLIHNSVNISRTHESFLPKIKNNLEETEEGKNVLTEFNYNSNDILSNNGNNNTNSLNKEKNKSTKIKLEDGISISIIKSHGEKRIKKFFHVPDFEIYVIKVI